MAAYKRRSAAATTLLNHATIITSPHVMRYMSKKGRKAAQRGTQIDNEVRKWIKNDKCDLEKALDLSWEARTAILHIIHKRGLKIIDAQVDAGDGKIDIMATDDEGKYHIFDLKCPAGSLQNYRRKYSQCKPGMHDTLVGIDIPNTLYDRYNFQLSIYRSAIRHRYRLSYFPRSYVLHVFKQPEKDVFEVECDDTLLNHALVVTAAVPPPKEKKPRKKREPKKKASVKEETKKEPKASRKRKAEKLEEHIDECIKRSKFSTDDADLTVVVDDDDEDILGCAL